MNEAMHYQNQTKRRDILLTVFFIVMSLYGFYKNGFTYYMTGYLSFFEAMYPLVFPLIAVLVGVGWNILHKRSLFYQLNFFLFISLLMPPAMPIWLYLLMWVLFLGCSPFLKKIPLSKTFLFKICTILLFAVLLQGNYENSVESSVSYAYGSLDLFLGRAVGNVGTTSILLLLGCFAVFCTDFYYKKEIPILSIVSYAVLVLFYSILTSSTMLILDLLNSHVWVVAIFFAPLNKYSPVLKKEQYGYAIILGICCFLFSKFFHLTNGAYVAYLLVQLGQFVIYKFLKKV